MNHTPAFRGFIIILMLAMRAALTLAPGDARVIASDKPARATTRPALSDEYTELLKRLREYNTDGMDHWTMNSEHLLAGEGDMRDQVIEFVRQPGGLDLLFDRLLDEKSTAAEQLATAELLVYYGQYRLKGDESLWSDRSQRVLAAIEQGRFDSAEKRYPDAPIKEQIVRAARRSEVYRLAARRPTSTTRQSDTK